MKAFGTTLCAAACLAVLSLPCLAQTSQWNGSWKADPASLTYEGPTYTVETTADGYTLKRSGAPDIKTNCNGQPNSNPDGSTTTCTKSGDTYQLETKRDGKIASKGTISSSGRTLTRKTEFYPVEGSPFTMTFESERVSGGPGAAGTWKQTKFNESQDTGILSIQVNGDTVAFKETDNDQPVECKLDGTDTKVPNGSMSVKLADPHTLKVTYKGNDGKVRRENTFELSADGNTVTETDVTPAPGPSKMSLKFHKS